MKNLRSKTVADLEADDPVGAALIRLGTGQTTPSVLANLKGCPLVCALATFKLAISTPKEARDMVRCVVESRGPAALTLRRVQNVLTVVLLESARRDKSTANIGAVAYMAARNIATLYWQGDNYLTIMPAFAQAIELCAARSDSDAPVGATRWYLKAHVDLIDAMLAAAMEVK